MGPLYSDAAALALCPVGAQKLFGSKQFAIALALVIRDGGLVEFATLRNHKQRFAVVAEANFSAFVLHSQLSEGCFFFVTKHLGEGTLLIFLLTLILWVFDGEDMNGAVIARGSKKSARFIEGQRANNGIFNTAAHFLERC